MNQMNQLKDGYYNYSDTSAWPTPILHAHTKQLVWEKQACEIPRQVDELDRTIGHAAFELWYRAHWEPLHPARLEAAPVEISA